jgi:NADPH:quinone reductase-like Zn-dependent oxidoreductase
MKAATRRKYGYPDSIAIEEIEKPIPASDELLVKVHNTTVNRTDCANLTAKPFIMRLILGLIKPRRIILGTDFAGIVEAIGKDVKTFNITDRVFGFNDLGASSQAEYLLVKAKDKVLSIPENIHFKEAAASLEGASYAYSFEHKVKIKKNQRVLINSATGGIGSALLQFIRQYDVEITATSNTENIELIKSLGADKVIDYTKEDFTMANESFDFIFDAVGKSTFGKCKSILNPGGIYSSSELGPFGQNLFLAVFSKRVVFPKPFPIKVSMTYIKKLLENGAYKPVIDREYELDNIAKAYDYVIEGQKTGNVIINIKPQNSTTK